MHPESVDRACGTDPESLQQVIAFTVERSQSENAFMKTMKAAASWVLLHHPAKGGVTNMNNPVQAHASRCGMRNRGGPGREAMQREVGMEFDEFPPRHL